MVSTTIAAGSNGVNVNTFAGAGTLNVASTTGFAASGTIYVATASGVQSVTYTAIGSSTTFTGCSSAGSGVMSTSGFVSQSNENGTTFSVAPRQPLKSGFFQSGQPNPNSGNYSSLSSTISGSTNVIAYGATASTHGKDIQLASSNTIITTPTLKTINVVTSGGGASTTTYYKMRGYYVAGATYETYVVTGAPSSTPPSGHTLTNVTVVAIWTI